MEVQVIYTRTIVTFDNFPTNCLDAWWDLCCCSLLQLEPAQQQWQLAPAAQAPTLQPLHPRQLQRPLTCASDICWILSHPQQDVPDFNVHQ